MGTLKEKFICYLRKICFPKSTDNTYSTLVNSDCRKSGIKMLIWDVRSLKFVKQFCRKFWGGCKLCCWSKVMQTFKFAFNCLHFAPVTFSVQHFSRPCRQLGFVALSCRLKTPTCQPAHYRLWIWMLMISIPSTWFVVLSNNLKSCPIIIITYENLHPIFLKLLTTYWKLL